MELQRLIGNFNLRFNSHNRYYTTYKLYCYTHILQSNWVPVRF